MKDNFLVVAMLCILFSGFSMADPVRISASEFAKSPAKVAALQKAVAAMRANDSASNASAAYLASWQYWANTHGYLGEGPNSAGTVATYVPTQIKKRCAGNPVCISYYTHLHDSSLPPDDFTARIWGTCQHSNLNFLPWHRLYLYFYERVLRKQSGSSDLSLPYWDYFAEKGAGGKGLALPTLVRGESAGPMYDAYRTPGLNEYKTAINANNASAVQAFKFNDFTNFSNTLQNQPHGSMHCGTGSECTAPDMGLVPLAGLDPVFYMHHANIDRLWQCWLNRKANGQTINLAWAKANLGMPDSWYQISYQFVDENGKPVTRTIADVFTPGVIDTHYDNENNCTTSLPRPKLPLLKQAVKSMKMIPVSNTKGAVLKGKVTTISLQNTSSALLNSMLPVKAGVKAGNALLIIENVDIQGDPQVTYNIYLGSKTDSTRSVYIATLNYFGVLESGHQHGAGAKIGTLTYDVQAELDELGVTAATDVTVKFEPASFTLKAVKEQVTSGSVVVGSVRLEKASDDADSHSGQ